MYGGHVGSKIYEPQHPFLSITIYFYTHTCLQRFGRSRLVSGNDLFVFVHCFGSRLSLPRTTVITVCVFLQVYFISALAIHDGSNHGGLYHWAIACGLISTVFCGAIMFVQVMICIIIGVVILLDLIRKRVVKAC